MKNWNIPKMNDSLQYDHIIYKDYEVKQSNYIYCDYALIGQCIFWQFS